MRQRNDTRRNNRGISSHVDIDRPIGPCISLSAPEVLKFFGRIGRPTRSRRVKDNASILACFSERHEKSGPSSSSRQTLCKLTSRMVPMKEI